MPGENVADRGTAYWASMFENGFTCAVQFIQEPVTTDITSTELGQAVLALKTAPYYTELFADKETGGLQAVYKTIKSEFNGIPLYTSEDEQAVVSGVEDLYARKY